MNIKCFLITETDFVYQYLRRYASGTKCPLTGNIHDAQIPIDDAKIPINESIIISDRDLLIEKYKDQFPTNCECGYKFTDEDKKQIFKERKYVDEKGNFMSINSAPIGAIWRATWYEDCKGYYGLDGKSYIVKTPGGNWAIDVRASNCTRPEDDIHKCWCRHGEAPNFTINKIGNTCSAGAGSIMLRNYHGFLINGELTNC